MQTTEKLALAIIAENRIQGFTYEEIRNAFRDGGVCANLDINKETSEEVYSICTEEMEKGNNNV